MFVSLFRRRFKTFASGMSLFAILMLTLAPTISQVLAQHEHGADAHTHGAMSMSAEDMAGMPGMAGMSGMSSDMRVGSASASASGTATTHTNIPADCSNPPWAACAYCVLLAHLPAIVSAALVSLVVMVIATRATHARWFAFPMAHRRIGPQARAPPFHP